MRTAFPATITVDLHGIDPNDAHVYPSLHREFLRITEGDTPVADINVSLFDPRIYYIFDEQQRLIATINVGDAIEQFLQMYPYLVEAAKKEIGHAPHQNPAADRPRPGAAGEARGHPDPTPEGWPKETL